MYASNVDLHHARKAVERLGKDHDKAPTAEAKTSSKCDDWNTIVRRMGDCVKVGGISAGWSVDCLVFEN